jgi:hypothetical protein
VEDITSSWIRKREAKIDRYSRPKEEKGRKESKRVKNIRETLTNIVGPKIRERKKRVEEDEKDKEIPAVEERAQAKIEEKGKGDIIS